MYHAHVLKFTKALLLEVTLLPLLPLQLLDHPLGKLSCVVAGCYHGWNAACGLGNTTILKDTLSALTELNNAQAMKKSYQDLVSLFNRPPPEQLTSDPFGWVYGYKHAQNNLLSDLEPLDQPINASISLTGSATLELTSVKPDDGAIVAIAGEKGAVWLGVVS